jgi:hypothetical protein
MHGRYLVTNSMQYEQYVMSYIANLFKKKYHREDL